MMFEMDERLLLMAKATGAASAMKRDRSESFDG